MRLHTLVLLCCCILTCNVKTAAFADKSENAWGQEWQYFIGDWKSDDAHGQLGSGSEKCSFQYDLGKHVILRRNHAEYALPGQPAAIHDDLMMIYPDLASKTIRADYYDSEGHIIRYVESASSDSKRLVLTSLAAAGESRYRLIYVQWDNRLVNILFQIATSSKPNDFRTYVEGKMHRSSAVAPS